MPTPRDRSNTQGEFIRMRRIPSENETLINDYISYKATTGRRWREGTIEVRFRQLRILARAIEPTSLLEATEDDLLAWHRRLDGRPETIAAYVSAARGLYRWMSVYARPRLRTDDPSIILERPALPPGLPRPMIDRHYNLALACAVSDPEMYLWLGLMGCSGLRCCEIAWMHISDVEQLDSGAGLLHITGKGGKRRTVPAGQMLMLTMRPFLRGQGPVFTRPSDGRAHTPHRVSQRVSRFLNELGIPAPHRAHSMRHRFGTDYHALDPDLYRQAKLMGHASVDTTQRYTEVSPVEAARYVEELTQRRLSRANGPARRAAA